jgi:hypothetical protein
MPAVVRIPANYAVCTALLMHEDYVTIVYSVELQMRPPPEPYHKY